MNARLQGFLNFLDLLAESQRRQGEAIAGRRFETELALQPVSNAKVVKFPLTGHQNSRLFASPSKRNVSVKH